MTNAQSLQQDAVQILDSGLLNGRDKEKERALVEKIRTWDKKRLQDLSKQEYQLLRNIVADAHK